MSTRAARHASPRRSPWRPLAVAAVGASVLAVAGQGVFAGLTASAVNTTPQAVGTGSLALTMAANGAGFAQDISGMAPGDVVNRHVTLTNGGTVGGGALSFGLAASAGNVLTDTTKGLQIKVTSCPSAWVATAGTCQGSTTGGTTVLSPRAIGTLVGGTAPLTGLTGTGTNHLQVSLSLPEQDEVTTNGSVPAGGIQNRSVALTYTFTAAQRTPTTTNS